jgi:hypothetical protein
MAERPILFSGPMVKAILEGKKTQTRRLLKIQPPSSSCKISTLIESTHREDRKKEGKLHWVKLSPDGLRIIYDQGNYFNCPYGEPGDRLWVRESARVINVRSGFREIDIEYQADKTFATVLYPSRLAPAPKGKLLSNGTYREASRIILEIDEIKVEKLQDITEEDAKAEGVNYYVVGHGPVSHNGLMVEPGYFGQGSYKMSFDLLWDQLYGRVNWESNPWVWVIKFHRVEVPQ